MLNLNAMFAGMEDITESVIPTRYDVSDTDNKITMLKYAELEHDFAIAENEAVKSEYMQLQLEQMLSMYDHVKQFGVDRTLLALYNSDRQLERAIDVKFPSCESVDCIGTPTSSYSQMFIAAMEDENGGLISKLWNWLKLLWESLKKLASVVWEKIKSFFGSANKSDAAMVQQIQTTVDDDDRVSSTIQVIKDYAFRAVIAGILMWVTKTISMKVGNWLDTTFTSKGDRESLMKHAGIDTEVIRVSKGADFKEWAAKLDKYAKKLDGAKDKVDGVFSKIKKENLENIIENNPDLKDEYDKLQNLHKGVNFDYKFDKNKFDGRSQFKQEGLFKSIFTKAGRAIKFHRNEADATAREISQMRILVHKGIQKLYDEAMKIKNPPANNKKASGNGGKQNKAPTGNNKPPKPNNNSAKQP